MTHSICKSRALDHLNAIRNDMFLDGVSEQEATKAISAALTLIHPEPEAENFSTVERYRILHLRFGDSTEQEVRNALIALARD